MLRMDSVRGKVIHELWPCMVAPQGAPIANDDKEQHYGLLNRECGFNFVRSCDIEVACHAVVSVAAECAFASRQTAALCMAETRSLRQ